MERSRTMSCAMCLAVGVVPYPAEFVIGGVSLCASCAREVIGLAPTEITPMMLLRKLARGDDGRPE